MKKKILIAAIAALTSVAAWATCTTHTTWYNGRMVTCQTCCYGSNCQTTCY